jgi:hypothetical protein
MTWVYDHSVLAGKKAEAESVIGFSNRSVVVQVKPRGGASVGRRNISVRILDLIGAVLGKWRGNFPEKVGLQCRLNRSRTRW